MSERKTNLQSAGTVGHVRSYESRFPVPEICNGKDDDCDGVADSGINTQTDPNNCGACNVKCAAANGTASCIAGHCAIASCNKYYQNLDNDPGNGCEFFCVPEGAEVCDGRDNDCNGKDR